MTLYSVRARGNFGGAEIFSFGYLLNSTVAESTVASTFTSAITTFWTTATDGYANYAVAAVALTDTVVYTLNPSLRVLSKTVTANAHAGTASGVSTPYDTAVTVDMKGALDTKSDRGRFKLPAPVSTTLSAGLYTSAFQTSLKNVLDAFFLSMHGLSGYQPVKVNRRANLQGDPAFTQHVVNAYSVSNKPGSNRQRTRKQLPTAFVTGTI
jgi:hypothetical protein